MMPPAESTLIRDEALADVEQAMLTGNWNRATQNALARKYGCTNRTIRNYFATVKRQWLRGSTLAETEEERRKWRVKMEVAQALAMRTGDAKAMASLLNVEANVLGLISPTRVQVSGGLDITARPERQLTDDELIARIEEKRKARDCQVIELREVAAGEGYETEG